jgi:hypothetical protein
MKHFIGRSSAMLGLAACFAGCGITEPSERIAEMDIASARVPCVSFYPRECLRVREHPDTTWTNFYDEIEGFAFEPGFEYTIRVAIRPVNNPMADASSLTYRLLAILRKAPPA